MRTCRAKALAEEAGKAGDPHSVPAGTYVEVHVADVPTSAAAAVVQRVSDTLQVCPADAFCLGLSLVVRTLGMFINLQLARCWACGTLSAPSGSSCCSGCCAGAGIADGMPQSDSTYLACMSSYPCSRGFCCALSFVRSTMHVLRSVQVLRFAHV